MDSNPNLELLVEKLFDDDEIIDQIMATDDMMELYTLCQKIQGGYTFEEFLEFFESLVCICLDEAKDLKTFIENNEDKVGKLSEKELKDISGGVSAKHKLTASVLASMMFLTNAGTSHVRGQEPDSAGGNVVLHNQPSTEDINKILIDVGKEKPTMELSTGQKILRWLDKATDYVWDHKGAILGSAAALLVGGSLLIADSEKIGNNVKALVERRNDIKEKTEQQAFLASERGKKRGSPQMDPATGKMKITPPAELSSEEKTWWRDCYIKTSKRGNERFVSDSTEARRKNAIDTDLKRLEDQGIIKTLTDKLVLGSAIVTIGGGIMTGLKELTGFVSKFAQAATDINTIKYYMNEGQKNVAAWRNALNINMQKQEAKNYDPDAEEDRLRYMFEHYIHGQEAAKDQIMSFFTQFGEERKAAAMGATSSDLPAPRVLIFNGPSGTGKTFMAELLCAGVTPIDPYIITASDILKASNSNPAAMAYSFFYGNTQNGGNNKDDFSAKNNLISFLQATQGSVRVIIIDEWDKIYKKDISGNWPIISPLEETLRDIVDNRLTDYNGAPVDLNGAVFIFTTNETTASLQGRIQIDPITGDFIEALVDENGDPILDQDGEQVYGKPKRDSSRTQTLVPHDGSLMARLSGSICYFDKLNTNDYEIIARDALGDDRNIKTVDDYIKAQRPSKVSLEKRLTTNIGGVIITDKGYRMIAEYASKMTNAARSIVGAGGNKTGSVSGTLDTAIIGYVAYLKNTSKSCKDLVLLAEPYETKNSTGRKTIQFRIKPVGYLDDEHTYEQYFEKCNNE